MSDDRSRLNTGLDDNWPDELERRFAGLRREEEQKTPAFVAMWPTGPVLRRHSGRWLIAAACAAIAVGSLLWIRSSLHRPRNNAVASITEWKAPTDFLLETPGHELLRTVPEIGGWHGYTPALLPVASPLPARKQVLHSQGRK